MTTLTGTVLLYNASFEPLGRVSFQHAVKMLVRQVAVVVNKMDMVDFDQEVFQKIQSEYREFLGQIGVAADIAV